MVATRASEEPDDVADDDLTASSDATEAACLDHWGSETVAVLPDDIARADADADE